jgi:hypothetical protein
MTNSEIIRKAEWTVGDLAAGGLLTTEQSDAFIRKLIIQPTILKTARVARMRSPKMEINKIGFGSRILRPGVSGVGLIQADRVKPDNSKITLSTTEVLAEIHLPYDVIEDNIERGGIGDNVSAGPATISGGIKDTIMTLIAERAATDLEELALQGDTASGDTYLALLDGYLKLATTNTVDGGAATVSRTLFKAGLQAMPDQYLRNLSTLRHYLAVDKVIDYRDSLAARNTALGDAQISSANAVGGFGVPVEMVPLMPAVSGLLTNPNNLIFGIQRKITIESDKDIREREFIIVLSARIDFKIEEETAVVKYFNIG